MFGLDRITPTFILEKKYRKLNSKLDEINRKLTFELESLCNTNVSSESLNYGVRGKDNEITVSNTTHIASFDKDPVIKRIQEIEEVLKKRNINGWT